MIVGAIKYNRFSMGCQGARPNFLREIRLRCGFSQTKLAAKVGVAQGLLSEIEHGKRWPWPKLRRRLAEALGVYEWELFPEFWRDESGEMDREH